MDKKKIFNKICRDIKSVKIQGAKNVAIAGLLAYKLIPTKKSKQKLLSLRPTEPMLENVLKIADKISYQGFIKKLEKNQNIINKEVYRLIKNNSIIFTHCHSTNVVSSLSYSKKQGKKFEVYLTETRPLYQGRKTAEELKKAKINVTMFIDSAVGVAISGEQKTKKVDVVFLGADALLKIGVINKIGSEVIARLAKEQKIPVYIIADSWKYTTKKVPLENRKFNEVWNKAPKKIKIRNPAFELIDKKFITGIISELGTFSYKKFLRKVNS